MDISSDCVPPSKLSPSGPHNDANAWPYPQWIAHRCGGALAPENTLAGFDACVQYGYRMVEFDAKLSADDCVFLLHDDMLERTTNGHGAAAQQYWQALEQLDAGVWYAPRFAGERLPLLAQAASRCQQLGVLANIEIKPCPGRDAITGRLVAMAAQAQWRTQTAPLLSSFSIEALAAARDAVPALPRGMLFESLPTDWRYIVRDLDCVSLHLDHKQLDASRVAEIKSAGLRVLAYTVNQPDRADELVRWGVDMICTDRIDLLGHARSPVLSDQIESSQ